MQRMRFLGLLLCPSLLSLSLASVIALLLLLSANWSYITSNHFVQSYIFGQYGISTVVEHSRSSLSVLATGILNNTLGYNATIVVFALIVGLIVYGILQLVDRLLADTGDSLQAVQFATGMSKKQAEKQLEERFGLRAAVLIAWVVYWVIFVKVLLPFSLLIARSGPDLASGTGWTYTLLGFLILLCSLHLHIVLIRLLALRPRLFVNSLD